MVLTMGSTLKSAIDVSFRMVLSGARLPTPADVSIDRDGAIRILWEVDDRTLELVCPYAPGQGPYIFYAEGEQHRIAYDLSVGQLNRLLSWLNGASNYLPKCAAPAIRLQTTKRHSAGLGPRRVNSSGKGEEGSVHASC
jgi:hypothetical protein